MHAEELVNIDPAYSTGNFAYHNLPHKSIRTWNGNGGCIITTSARYVFQTNSTIALDFHGYIGLLLTKRFQKTQFFR